MEVVVKIDKAKFNEFKNIIKDMNAEILNLYPDEIVVGNYDEVRKRVYEAEHRIKNGEYVDEKEFDNFIKKLVNENN